MFFTKSFRPTVQQELRARRQFDYVQSVKIPHVRVTSLVEGTLPDPRWGEIPLYGFTLGIPDPNIANSLDSYFNTSGKGTAVGVTYIGGVPSVVKLPDSLGEHRKLPTPGVTDVDISTHSKAGLMFKAIINLKFFGKDQYDFIYQTFMRPGNHVAIEYGHTHQDLSVGLPNLGFFRSLDGTTRASFKDALYGTRVLKTTRNAGSVVGFVTNFSIKLNEKNEYEATVELMNSLEWLYTTSPEDTFMEYGAQAIGVAWRLPRDTLKGEAAEIAAADNQEFGDTMSPYARRGANAFTRSIRANFGHAQGEDYEPKYDVILRTMLSDAITNPKYAKNILLPHEFNSYLMNDDYEPLDTPLGIITPSDPLMKTRGLMSTTAGTSDRRIGGISPSEQQKRKNHDPNGNPFGVRPVQGSHEESRTNDGRPIFTFVEGSLDVATPPGPYVPGGMLTDLELESMTMRTTMGIHDYVAQDESVADLAIRESQGDRWYSHQVVSKAESDSENFFVSLDYFLNRLLNKIISYSFSDRQGLFHNLSYDAASNLFILLPGTEMRTSFGGRTSQQESGLSSWRRISRKDTQAADRKGISAAKYEASREVNTDDGSFVGWWQDLRSNDITKVIINNPNIYKTGRQALATDEYDKITDPFLRNAWGLDVAKSDVSPVALRDPNTDLSSLGLVPLGAEEDDTGVSQIAFDINSSGYFYQKRKYVYGQKYEGEARDNLFRFNNLWRRKGLYTPVTFPSLSEGEANKYANFNGIFVNYVSIRNAFLNSSSVGAAIKKVLGVVNEATGGILQLKMRMITREQAFETTPKPLGISETEEEVQDIVIVDESVMPSTVEVKKYDPYVFFEGQVSEAISYDYDFSLPASVASVVMSNTFDQKETSAGGGDPEKKMLIDYGYKFDITGTYRIKNIIEYTPDEDGPTLGVIEWPPNLRTGGGSGISWGGIWETIVAAVDPNRTLDEVQADAFAKSIEGDKDFRDILGYRELEPPVMKAEIIDGGLYNTIPNAGTINIKLQGIDGFRWGDMFTVRNVLPDPYDDNSIFFVTGYKHSIDSNEWITELQGQLISSKPDRSALVTGAMKVQQTALTDAESLALENKVRGEEMDHDQIQQHDPDYYKRWNTKPPAEDS